MKHWRNFVNFICIFFVILFSTILVLFLIREYNLNQIKPSAIELEALHAFYGKLFYIKTKEDVVNLNLYTIQKIRHELLDSTTSIDISKIIKYKRGLCYDRTLLMEKVLTANNIKIRSIYFFYSTKHKTTWFDFFIPNTLSHSVFEYFMNNQWYLCDTRFDLPLYFPMTIEQYQHFSKFIPKHAKYIVYLNNRNGHFIYPAWLPDIY